MFPRISVDPGRGKPPIELQKSFDTDLETNNKTVVNAINEINRKIGYDTYSNWTTNNPVLKNGEVAIATIETNSDGIQNSPAVVVKVGDGTSAYNSLKFVSGLAADVYSWAKQSTKPTYSASEISGLSDFISGGIEDTNTTYQIVKVDDYNYKLQSKNLNGEWVDVDGGTITIPAYDDTEISNKVDTLIGDDAGKSVRTIANEELAAQLIPESASESLDTLQEIAAWIQSHPDDASAMNAAITALKNKLSGIDDGTETVKKYIDDAITALSIGDYAKLTDLASIYGDISDIQSSVSNIDTTLETVLKYKGSVDNYNALPASPSLGDTYNIKNESTASVFYLRLIPITDVAISDSGMGYNEISAKYDSTTYTDLNYFNNADVNFYDSNGNLVVTGGTTGGLPSGGFISGISIAQNNPDASTIVYMQVEGYGTDITSANEGEAVYKSFTINAGDNVVWNGDSWDVLAGTVDLSQYALKTEMPTKLSQLTNDANYSKFSGSYHDLLDKPEIKVGVVYPTETTIEIQPNTMYIFGEAASLTITLAEPSDTEHLNEYMFEFTSGATATALTVPDTVKWVSELNIEANKIYQVSIVNNIGIIMGV